MIYLLPLAHLAWQKPVVDITVGSSTRIVQDAGAGGYQAFPDVCRTKDGRLFCVFYAGYGHISHPTASLPRGGRICAITSSDEGDHWSEARTIIDTPVDDRDPSVVQLPSGELICNFFTYGREGECDTCISRSLDGGSTWSEPEIIVPSFATSTPIRRLKNGHLLLPVYNVDANGKRPYTAVSISRDGGRTFQAPRIVGRAAGMTLDETDYFQRKDGTVLAVMREVMAQSESHDNGQTWSPVTKLGFAGHCPYMLMTRSGVLLMAHRLPRTSLHFSIDEGRTWQGPILLGDYIGAYPSMVQLKNGQVLCVFYEEGQNSAIRAVKLNIKR